MRRFVVIGGGFAVFAIAIVLLWPSRGPATVDSLYQPGGPVPADAAQLARTLVSADPTAQRGALVPELDQALPKGRLFPERAELTLEDRSWHEQHGFANAMGRLDVPGQPSQRLMLAFAKRDGAWRITLAEVVR